jgi:Zn-finger nucleic acid-binding protein
MDCPKCGVKLARDQYENATVFLCTSCSGYFIKRNRLLLIKQSRERSEDVLRHEAETQTTGDSAESLRCPRCRAVKMQKERIRVEPEGEFLLDVCKKCDHVWFDGGELARWQLDHEAGESAREAEQFRRRVESRTPEEQAALEARLAQAPSHSGVFATALSEVALIAITVIGLLLALGAVFFSAIAWAVAGSLLATLSLAYLMTRFLHTRNSLIAGIAAVAIAEIAFLCFLFFFFR